MSELSVEVKGKIDHLQKSLKDGEKAVNNFGSKVNKSTTRVEKSFNRSSKGVSNLGKATANANPTLQEFSRVIQDAPYGIQGVGNNITQLVSQFGYLQKSAGGTKGAFKLLLSSLAGPGGMIFVVSTAVSLLTVFGDKLLKTADKADKLTDATKDLVGSAESEITILNSLLSIAKNENESKTNRQRAISKINDLYGDYLPNLKLENIGTQNVTTSTNKLTEALIRQAKIKGLQSRISELYTKKFEEETKAQTKIASKLQQTLGGFGFIGKGVQERLKPVNDEIGNLTKKIKELLSEDIEVGGVFTGVKGSGNVDKIRQKVAVLGGELKNSLNGIQEIVSKNPVSFINPIIKRFDNEALLMKARLNQFSEEISNIVNNGLVNAFSGIGQAIGNALAGAGNLTQNLGSALMGAIGGILTQLGTSAIAIGIGLKKIKIALASLNPVAAIGAGVALVALGSAFSAKASSLSNSIGGSGGSVSNNTSTSGGSSGGSGFTGGFSGSGGNQRVVFEIAGRKLIGVMRNEIRATGNTGATLSFS